MTFHFMSPPVDDAKPMSPTELEAALHAIGAERYHNLHPFHRLLHAAS